MNEKLEALARELEESLDYKVLRRLELPMMKTVGGSEKVLMGTYADCETTGLDVEKDEVIELALWPFYFTTGGQIVDVSDEPFHYYRQPSKPIPLMITKLTGIDDAKVAGQKIDLLQVENVVKRSAIVIAHHAAFDRQVLERVTPVFEGVCWGCSMAQAPWQEHGHSGKRLEYILGGLGKFYEAHNAVDDCEAGIFALTADLGGRTALDHVLEASRKTTYHVWALKADYDYKDVLKARGYFWNGGEDGRPKAWHKEIPETDRGAEEEWIARAVYNSMHSQARFDRVTAFERFSKRG